MSINRLNDYRLKPKRAKRKIPIWNNSLGSFFIFDKILSIINSINFRRVQNKDNPYSGIFAKVMSDYGGSFLDTGTKGELQNCAIIQYEETDWEFLKRMASHTGAVLVPDIKGDKPQLWVGVPEGDEYNQASYNYSLAKDLESYLKFNENQAGWSELDLTGYKIETVSNYSLGDKVTYNQVVFAISEKETELRNGILIHKYILKQKRGIKQNKYYSQGMCGLSIDGKVIAVEMNKLKLHLSIDKSQSISEAYWYTFQTPYTTESETGWYSMPQVGDSVKLYIPKPDEAEAYIKWVNRLDGETNAKTQDPAIKYYGTIHGKEQKLAPKELTFSAIEKNFSIKLLIPSLQKGLKTNAI